MERFSAVGGFRRHGLVLPIQPPGQTAGPTWRSSEPIVGTLTDALTGQGRSSAQRSTAFKSWALVIFDRPATPIRRASA
jgi:hypothetical protein